MCTCLREKERDRLKGRGEENKEEEGDRLSKTITVTNINHP
jgi:hypothetical protein